VQGSEYYSKPAVGICSTTLLDASGIVLLVISTLNCTFPVRSQLFVGIMVQRSAMCDAVVSSASCMLLEFASTY